MRKLFKRIFISSLIFCMTAGQAAALDLQIGSLDFGPPCTGATGSGHRDNNGFGAKLTIPFGSSDLDKSTRP